MLKLRAKHIALLIDAGPIAMAIHLAATNYCDAGRSTERLEGKEKGWVAGRISRKSALTIFPGVSEDDTMKAIAKLLRMGLWQVDGRLNYLLPEFAKQTESDKSVLWQRRRDSARKASPSKHRKGKPTESVKTGWVEWRLGSAKYPPEQREISDAEEDRYVDAKNEWLATSEWADFDYDKADEIDPEQAEITDAALNATWYRDGYPAFMADQKKRGVDPELIAWYADIYRPYEDDDDE